MAINENVNAIIHSRLPVSSLGELFELDPAEIEAGYRDGLEGLPCGDNRGRGYWHGWRNAQMDRGLVAPDWASSSLAHEVVRFGIMATAERHRALWWDGKEEAE